MTELTGISPVAFYLPQYHPIPENDEWWGPGFTEWTSVAAARPLFKGHAQPRLPGELGFYDLRLAETRIAQARLADKYGVAAFCYWHYWFGGRRLLERPINEVLSSGEPDFPFCLGWANADWTSVWVGRSRQVLIRQEYGERADWQRHYDHLAAYFEDRRYLTVFGRPLLYIYKPLDIPQLAQMADEWARRAELDHRPRPFLVGEVDTDSAAGRAFIRGDTSLDAVVDVSWNRAFGPGQRYRRRLPGGPMRRDFLTSANRLSTPSPDDARQIPLVLTGWDNTPRFGRRGIVLESYTPRTLRQHVADVIATRKPGRPTDALVFVKSWNEWAEGNYLEPDREAGHDFLRAFRDGLRHAGTQR